MPKKDSDTMSQNDLSRRQFLRNSALLTAGVSLASMATIVNAPVAESAQAVAEKKKIIGKARSLMIERANCTGCHSCVFACSMYHENVVRPSTARIYIKRYYGLVDVPMLCWHCSDAPCVAACPVTPEKAVVKNKETGVVEFTDENKCLAATCNKCIEACPPQYLRRHPETAKPMFCDLCGGDPQCVKACTRQSAETGETLRSDNQVGGLHWSYREVTPDEAADGLMKKLFYPNTNGERR